MTLENLENLEKVLGIHFQNKNLLKQALVHRSFLNEKEGREIGSNERLEFLGDAVLSYVVSDWLYQKFPEYPEGTLTNLRSNLVRTYSLAKLAEQFSVGEYLLLSKGEIETGGRQNSSLLANSFEAIIGAYYLDQGITKIQQFIIRVLSPLLTELVNSGKFKDNKSLLQEILQSTVKESPVYKTLKEEGPDHAKTFTIGVFSLGELLATGVGKSKQIAEEEAARIALEKSEINR